MPTPLTDGLFQNSNNMEPPLFGWEIATPPHLEEFDNFMLVYRAETPSWYDVGFYPVVDRLIKGFDNSRSETLSVDVGGGRGHNMQQFVAQHKAHPEKVVLQDQAIVIASIQGREHLVFECEAHDFFTPQPIHGARIYSLYPILHDWTDEDGIKILENLKPALKPGYSRVLLNYIILSEDKSTVGTTSMDMMMLAHLAVRERIEKKWKGILEKAGLQFLQQDNA